MTGGEEFCDMDSSESWRVETCPGYLALSLTPLLILVLVLLGAAGLCFYKRGYRGGQTEIPLMTFPSNSLQTTQ